MLFKAFNKFDIAIGVAIALSMDELDKQVVDWDVVEDSVDLNEPLVGCALNSLTCEFLVCLEQVLVWLTGASW